MPACVQAACDHALPIGLLKVLDMNCQDNFNCPLLELTLDCTKRTCHLPVCRSPGPPGLSPSKMSKLTPSGYCGGENRLYQEQAVLIFRASRCQPHLLLVWSQAQPSVHTFPKPMVIPWWLCWLQVLLCWILVSSYWLCQNPCQKKCAQSPGELQSLGNKQTHLL